MYPGGTSGKESACQGRRCKGYGLDPWVGKITWRRKWQPTPVFFPGQSHGQRSLVGYGSWGHKESDTTEHMCTHTHTHTHTHVCSHTYTCVHTETHVCTHAHAHMCAYMRVCAHTYTCACTQGHTYTRVRAHMCVHTHTHVCTHTHYVPSLQLSHPDLISAQGHEKYSPISR